MSVVLLQCDQENQKPGTWWKGGSGYVFIRCPLCAKGATLRDSPDVPPRNDGTRGHSIMADGTVSPSIVCPHKDCTWHVWGRLVGWQIEAP